jgi:GR25 family glycosyltransferase involved in LPS biosynthesis
MDYKIFVISLKRRQDRREKISELFEKNNLKFSFYDAIDGRDLIVTDEIEELFLNNEFEEWGIIKECIYGNTLTHLNLLKECSEQNLPYFIFEDDVKIKKDINFTFESIVEKKLDVFWLIDLEPSSLAYVVWPEGAKKIHDWMMNVGKADKGMDWKLLEIKNTNLLYSDKIWDEYFYQVPGEDSDIAPNGYNLIQNKI